MKIPRVVFVIVGCAALIQGRAVSVTFAMSRQQAPAKTSSSTASKDFADVAKPLPKSDQQTKPESPVGPLETRDTSRSKRSSATPGPSKVNRANPASRNPRGSASGSTANHYQPGTPRAIGAARKSAVENNAANGGSLARSARVSRLSTSPPNSERHHSPNPAVVGGFSDKKRNTSLNGTQMNRKP
jgi:hypothetical protein